MKRISPLLLLFFLSACFINYLGKGYEAYQKGDLEGAERFMRTAVKKKPRDPIAYNNLGVVLVELDKTDEALKNFKMAVVLSKDPYASPHVNLAKIYYDDGKLDLAKESAEKAVAIDAANPAALVITAAIYCSRNEKLQQALTFAKTAAEKLPDIDKASAWSTIAEAQFKLKNVEAAIVAIDTDLSMDTDNSVYKQQKTLYSQ